jgi:1-acyl-sn-glycerol-3-phosphate acyltransferase
MSRTLRIVAGTFSLYVVTHAVAFTVLPVALVLALLGRTASCSRLTRWFATTVFRVVGKRLHVFGARPPVDGSHFVIVSNYPSGYAGFALLQLFPDASIVVNDLISRVPLLGAFLRRNGAMFVNRKRPRRALREIEAALRDRPESDVIILPEGRRSPDGRMHDFKHGFVHLARRGGLDVLPVTLNGFYSLKPSTRFWLDPDARLEVVIHEPLANSELRKLSDHEAAAAVERIVGEDYSP